MRFRSAVYLVLLTSAPLPAQLLPDDAEITASAIDSAGSIYLAGSINSADLPVTPGVFEPTAPPNICSYFPGGEPIYCPHAFVAKLPPSGDRLLWASYLQGNSIDTITAMAVDPEGRIFVGGSTTSTTLLFRPGPFPPGPFRTAAASLFLYQVSSDGRYLLSGTFFGGSAQDRIADLKLDASRHVYIAGRAMSNPFPTTPGAYQQVRENFFEPFVAEFDPSFSRLIFSTLIGQSGGADANVLALGADGTVYVGGGIGEFANSPIVGPILVRLSADGARLLYSTVLPNTSKYGVQLGVFSLAVDSSGNAYAGTDNHTFSELGTLFGTISKLDPQGNIVASQDIGGDVLSLALGTDGTLFVFGNAQAGQLATTPGALAACVGPGGAFLPFPGLPYAAEVDPATLKISYAGYMTGGISQVAPGRILVEVGPPSAYGSFSVVETGQPFPGAIACMANAASGVTIMAPGELMIVSGYQIGPATPAGPVLDSAGNITSDIGGLTVSVAGLPAPLLYVSSNQINLVVPFGIPTAGSVRVELRRNGALVSTFDQVTAPQNLGLFTANSAGQLAALNQDGSVNGPHNPALKGTIVSIFATGLGAMTPPQPDGSRPLEPVAVPVRCPEVWVGTQIAEIDYCGNAPGLVEGLVQINFRVPLNVTAELPPSNAVSVLLDGRPQGLLPAVPTIAIQ